LEQDLWLRKKPTKEILFLAPKGPRAAKSNWPAQRSGARTCFGMAYNMIAFLSHFGRDTHHRAVSTQMLQEFSVFHTSDSAIIFPHACSRWHASATLVALVDSLDLIIISKLEFFTDFFTLCAECTSHNKQN
jgi:hypothetical protein